MQIRKKIVRIVDMRTIVAVLIIITTIFCLADVSKVYASVTEKSNKKTVYATENVNIRTKPKVNSKSVGILYATDSIKRISTLSNGWTKVKYKGEYRYIKTEYLTTKAPTYVDKSTPSNNSFKSYMDWDSIKSKYSNQYKLKQYGYIGKYGIITIGGRYCIAVGSYYTTTIGQYVDLIMKNGEVIKCIVGDCKSDSHTDSTNRQNSNGSIVEFIVNTSSLSSAVKKSGSLSSASSSLSGEIKYIRVYDKVYDY